MFKIVQRSYHMNGQRNHGIHDQEVKSFSHREEALDHLVNMRKSGEAKRYESDAGGITRLRIVAPDGRDLTTM